MKNDSPSVKEPKPSIHLTSKELPQIKDWEIGEKYTVRVVITMREVSQGDMYDDGGDNKKYRATFEIESIKPMEMHKIASDDMAEAMMRKKI